MARTRARAAALLVTIAFTGAGCGADDGGSQDDAPVNEDTPSGQQQGETTPAPRESERGSGY